MFQLVMMSDTVHVHPNQLGADLESACLDSIHGKYSNRVIPAHGLAIAVHSIVSIGPPLIHPIDGGSHCHCQFNLIVFAPFEGEILLGTVKQCDPTGILISLGFFDWLVLPGSEMQTPKLCVYDKAEQLWMWKYEGHELYIDLNTAIRVKVTKVEFAKGEQLRHTDGSVSAGDGGGGTVSTNIAMCNPAMKVTASIADDGLGLLAWWD